MRLNPTAKIYLECLIAGAKYAAFAYAVVFAIEFFWHVTSG